MSLVKRLESYRRELKFAQLAKFLLAKKLLIF